MSEFIRTIGSQGIVLQEYQGKYSIAAAWEGKDGKTNLKWGKEQKGKDEYAEKATPIKVSIGEKEVAIGSLLTILKELGWQGADKGDSEVPF